MTISTLLNEIRHNTCYSHFKFRYFKTTNSFSFSYWTLSYFVVHVYHVFVIHFATIQLSDADVITYRSNKTRRPATSGIFSALQFCWYLSNGWKRAFSKKNTFFIKFCNFSKFTIVFFAKKTSQLKWKRHLRNNRVLFYSKFATLINSEKN